MKTLAQIFAARKKKYVKSSLAFVEKLFDMICAKSAVYNGVKSVKNLYFIYFHILFLFILNPLDY